MSYRGLEIERGSMQEQQRARARAIGSVNRAFQINRLA